MNTYALMKAFMVNREQVSAAEFPPFLFAAPGDPNFLHLNPATPTFAESNGSAIAGITVDFGGIHVMSQIQMSELMNTMVLVLI